jgi:hypothetical protein
MLPGLEVPFMRRAAIGSSFLSLATAGVCSGLLAGVLTGCPDRSISKVDPLQGRVEFKDIPVTVNRDIDLLFLIDDSPSMLDKQTNLAVNFPKFIDVLKTIPGGLPNVHIAVATSDLGTKGAAKAAPGPQIGTVGSGGCSGFGKNGNMRTFTTAMGVQAFINDTTNPDGSHTTNYPNPDSPTGLADAFTMIASAGAGGCGFEQHLEAVKQALLPDHTSNAGFLRADAYLAVIIIADEDDCSLSDPGLLTSNENGPLGPLQSFRCTQFGVTCDDGGATTGAMKVAGTKGNCHPADNSQYLTTVADYVTALKALKPDDPSKVIVAGILGTTDPFMTELRAPPGGSTKFPALAHSCTYNGRTGPEVADPPIRLKAFLDQFPNRNTFASICQPDLTGALIQIGDLLKTVIGDPCIEGKLVGPPYECSVSSVTDLGKPTQTETIMPKCNPEDGSGTAQPCWHVLATDAMTCPNADHLVLKIEHEDVLKAQNMDSHVLANCVTEVIDNGP